MGQDGKEEIVDAIHQYLTDMADSIRSARVYLDKFIIQKVCPVCHALKNLMRCASLLEFDQAT